MFHMGKPQCRVCLSEGNDLATILEYGLREMFTYCTSLYIEDDDDLPKYICKHCRTQLIKANNFKLLSIKTATKCVEYLATVQSDDLEAEVIEDEIDIKYNDLEERAIQDYANDSSSLADIKGSRQQTESQSEPCAFKCDLCNSTFSSLLETINHTQTQYFCRKCNTKFCLSQQLSEHKCVFVSEKPFKCDRCDKCFVDEKSLNVHSLNHTSKETYICKQCGVMCKSFNDLKTHMLAHKDEKWCNICKKSFSREYYDNQHIQEHKILLPFMCESCGNHFANEEERRHHIKKKHQNTFCEVCDAVLPSHEALKKHIETHIGDSEILVKNEEEPIIIGENIEANGVMFYKCIRCFESFTRESDLVIHGNAHPTNDVPKCGICGNAYSSLRSLRIHVRTHLSEPPLVRCPFCQKKFICSLELAKHHRSEHYCSVCQQRFCSGHDLAVHMAVHSGKKLHACSKCGKTFATHRTWKSHRRTHTTQRKHVCQHCGANFKTSRVLQQHLMSHAKRKQCPTCKKVFSVRHYMNVHIKEPGACKAPKMAFTCQFCSREFTTLLQKNRHMYVDHKRFVCPVCEDSFETRELVLAHMCTHANTNPEKSAVKSTPPAPESCTSVEDEIRAETEEKRLASEPSPTIFGCPACDRVFTNNSSLRAHMKSHKDLKPYACTICEQAFRQQVSLNRHYDNMHRPLILRQFQCSQCPKSYGNRKFLRRHMVSHCEEKRYCCKVCNRKFNQKPTLVAHMRVHTGERYVCDWCGRKFVQKCTHDFHVRNVHAQEKARDASLFSEGVILEESIVAAEVVAQELLNF